MDVHVEQEENNIWSSHRHIVSFVGWTNTKLGIDYVLCTNNIICVGFLWWFECNFVCPWKKGGNADHNNTCRCLMMMDACVLYDLWYIGDIFTWHPGAMPERLHQDLNNEDWIYLQQNATILHIEYNYSNHIPIMLDTKNYTQYLLFQVSNNSISKQNVSKRRISGWCTRILNLCCFRAHDLRPLDQQNH